MTTLSSPQTAQQCAERFLFGLRVEVSTTKEIQYVMRFLDRKMPHWAGEKWDYSSVRPRGDLPAIGLTGKDHPSIHIIDGCVTVSYLTKDENTISFAEFLTLSRKRGHYKPRSAKAVSV